MIVLLILIFLGILIADFWLTAIFSYLYHKDNKQSTKDKPWTALYPD
jgi:hypothetical protein